VTAIQALVTIVCALGIAGGQILFKLTADSLTWAGLSSLVRELPFSLPFISALLLYGSVTALWIWVLQGVPLNRVYPFFALSFLFVPLLSNVFLAESVSVTAYAGGALIIAGIVVVTSSAVS
jgi:drug/metabolite transporter (DMT)-like permease